jgi:hypothetical protein
MWSGARFSRDQLTRPANTQAGPFRSSHKQCEVRRRPIGQGSLQDSASAVCPGKPSASAAPRDAGRRIDSKVSPQPDRGQCGHDLPGQSGAHSAKLQAARSCSCHLAPKRMSGHPQQRRDLHLRNQASSWRLRDSNRPIRPCKLPGSAPWVLCGKARCTPLAMTGRQ